MTNDEMKREMALFRFSLIAPVVAGTYQQASKMQHREAFKRMIEDAASKQIDLILCASVSRFARNMSDCLTQVRQLKSMNPSHPVGVYFETENILSLTRTVIRAWQSMQCLQTGSRQTRAGE